jgi:LuxR family maltose regulon positive regulatory protein
MKTGLGQRALETKLRPPSQGVRHMPRPRLFAGRGGGEAFRLALVSAPAGAGKTTLLAEWFRAIREAGGEAAWLSIDEFDNPPRRFLASLLSAIRLAKPRVGREAVEVLAANPDAPIEYVAESLLLDLGADASPLTVFLDDYHEIREKAIHALMDFLVRNAPDGVRFVVGTRKDPPLSIERLRMRGGLLELRWDDLRFSPSEADAYLNDTCRLGLSDRQVASLCDRTEGWITGLQLAAMTFPGAGDPDRIVASVTGAQRKIAGYLLEDVFRRQPPDVQRFLMMTAILDRMTAPLCDRLTGRQDGRRMIEALENGNLFLFGLDDQRCWFRYHALFAGFLQNRLRTESPGEVEGLHDRASDWFEKNGLMQEAVRHAIEGNRFRRAARLLEISGREQFRQGDFRQLRGSLDALPEEIVRRSATLCTLHAWALSYLGEFEGARARIADAERAIASDPPDGTGGASQAAARDDAELRLLRAVLGIIRRDEPDVSGLTPDLMSHFPPGEAALRGYAAIALGFASRAAGDLPDALARFLEAIEITDAVDSSLVNLNARLNVGIVTFLMGRSLEAEQSFRASIAIADKRRWLRSIGAAFLRYGLALTLHDQNRLTEAQSELSEGIALIEAGEAFGFLGVALVERARANAALRRPDLAAADLEHAREIARDHDVQRVTFRADLLDARMAILRGDSGRAAKFLEAAAVHGKAAQAGDRFPEKHEVWLIERIRLLIAQKQFDDAAKLSARAVRSATAAGRGRHVIEFLVLQALAIDGLSRRDKALATLGDALKRADGNGVVRPFVNAGGRLIPLLRLLEGNRALRASAAPLLKALQDRGTAVFGKKEADPIDEPFHHREVQILDLISKGLRNREIGKRLFLSEETVKWYLKRLYTKLYVGTRTEAVNKARKLGLIP